MILFKVQGFFAKLRKNLAPEQFKSLHRHARVKVLLNCSAGIKLSPAGVRKAATPAGLNAVKIISNQPTLNRPSREILFLIAKKIQV